LNNKTPSWRFIIQLFDQSCGMVVVPNQEKGKMGWLIETTSLFCAARLANSKYWQDRLFHGTKWRENYQCSRFLCQIILLMIISVKR
jgi:hypothetical protein